MGADDEALRVPERLAFAGDWHMNAMWAVRAIEHAAELGVATIVHAGDFGYLFYPRYLRPLQRALEAHDMQLLFVDGNHDDHNLLGRLPSWPSGLRCPGGHERIWWMPRGFRWEWNGIRFVALGGAHSVDRGRRRAGESWWPEETITGEQAAYVVNDGPADVMITHDCPTGIDIPGLDESAAWFPPAEIASADQHRTLLRSVVDHVRPRLLVHGHYHRRHLQTVNFGWDMTVLGLDCDGADNLTDNLHVIDLSEVAYTVRENSRA